VNRQEVYRLLDALRQKGLVKQNLTVPTSFAAVPIGEGVKRLLEQKTSELTIMSKTANRLARKLGKTASLCPPLVEVKPCFGTVFEADRGKNFVQTIKTVQDSIEIVTSWVRFKQSSFQFEAQLKGLLKKGVAMHIVVEKPPVQFPRWVNQALLKYPNFELKTMPEVPATAITIFDHTQAAIAYSPTNSLAKGPTLYTDNPTLITLSQTYFNTIWAQTPKTADSN